MADLDLYEVPVRGHTTTMRLTAEDAKALYGDQAKKVGPVEPTVPNPAPRPPWAVEADEDGNVVESDEKQAPPPRNKARSSK